MYLCQYCGEVFDEPTVEEEKDVGYHGLSCPRCGEALGPLSELEARPCPLCSGWRWKNDAACGTCREDTQRRFRWLMKAGFGRTEMEVIDQMLEGNSLMDVIGEDKKEEKEKC